MDFDISNIIQLILDLSQKLKYVKKNAQLMLIMNLEKCLWNWIESHTSEFTDNQIKPNEDLTDCCDKLFSDLNLISENHKRKTSIWSLQVMLLILCPKILEEITNAETGAPCSAQHIKKKHFVDIMKKCLVSHNMSKSMLDSSLATCIKLCKASTYININQSNNVMFIMVQSVMAEVKAHLFNVHRPYSRGSSYFSQDKELMRDFFITCFRVNPHGMDLFKLCVNTSSPMIFHFVLFDSLHKIVTQPSKAWWPKIDILFNKSVDLRNLFSDVLTKATHGLAFNASSRSSTSFKEKVTTLKFKDKSEENPNYKQLLLCAIKLFNMKPILFLNHRSAQDHHKFSVAELINALASLVHLASTMPEVAQEAMNALLHLHSPDIVPYWCFAPNKGNIGLLSQNTLNFCQHMLNFWSISSQVILSVCQKLIQRHIPNYCNVLRWLWHVLTLRNEYMLNKPINFSANEQNLLIAKQMFLKLEVVCFTFIWSVNIDAVLISMSIFANLCKEVDIRCRCNNNEKLRNKICPNYEVYKEIAKTSSSLVPTGRAANQKQVLKLLRRIEYSTTATVQAWEDAYKSWEALSKNIISDNPLTKLSCKPSIFANRFTNQNFSSQNTMDAALNSPVSVINQGDLSLNINLDHVNQSFQSSNSNESCDHSFSPSIVSNHHEACGTHQITLSSSEPRQNYLNFINYQWRYVHSDEKDPNHDINEWANITGYLLACGHLSQICDNDNNINTYSLSDNKRRDSSNPTMMKNEIFGLTSALLTTTSSRKSSLAYASLDSNLQYSPITQFIDNLLQLLVCENEKYGLAVQTYIKDLLSNELHPTLYPILFEQIRMRIDKFFLNTGEVLICEANSRFMEHVLFMIKQVLEKENIKMDEFNIENLVSNIIKYVRYLDISSPLLFSMKIKTCQLVETMMKRRMDLTFRQEIKFRNKLVEYIVGWIVPFPRFVVSPFLTPFPSYSNSNTLCNYHNMQRCNSESATKPQYNYGSMAPCVHLITENDLCPPRDCTNTSNFTKFQNHNTLSSQPFAARERCICPNKSMLKYSGLCHSSPYLLLNNEDKGAKIDFISNKYNCYKCYHENRQSSDLMTNNCNECNLYYNFSDEMPTSHSSERRSSLIPDKCYHCYPFGIDGRKYKGEIGENYFNYVKNRELDSACLNALALLLDGLPLQPQEMDRGNVMEAKSLLFQKYLTVFLNLVNGHSISSSSLACPDLLNSSEHPSSCVPFIPLSSTSTKSFSHFYDLTILTASRMLNANLDIGLTHCVSHAYLPINPPSSLPILSLPSAFLSTSLNSTFILEMLANILREGAQFDSLSDSAHGDRFGRLTDLVTMITDSGELPIASALAYACSQHPLHADALARTLVRVFEEKHLSYQLYWNAFSRQTSSPSYKRKGGSPGDININATISSVRGLGNNDPCFWRGNDFVNKLMSACFRTFGATYLKLVLSAPLRQLYDTFSSDPTYSLEVDPERLISKTPFHASGIREDIKATVAVNASRLQNHCDLVLSAVTNSGSLFPPQLRTMCHCLQLAVRHDHYDDDDNSANTTLPSRGLAGSLVILRFINPAILVPQEYDLLENGNQSLDPRFKRGLTLIGKVLQKITNGTLFKESYMKPFNPYLRTNINCCDSFFNDISSELSSSTNNNNNCHEMFNNKPTEQLEDYDRCQSYIDDNTLSTLHKLLWTYQEKIGEYLMTSYDHKTTGRRPFDKLTTLLGYLGPPNQGPATTNWVASEMNTTRFEEMMTKHNVQDKDDFKNIKSLNIFYQSGVSKEDHPVFYYIARRYQVTEMNGDLLLYHIILTLKPYSNKPFDIVLDLTNVKNENRFKTDFLPKWFLLLPDQIFASLSHCYVYNCNSWVREFTKFHDRILSPLKNNQKLLFIESLSRLGHYIDPCQQKLPSTTLSLDDDLKIYGNALKLAHKGTRVTIKIGPEAIQVNSLDRTKILGYVTHLNDVYYASEIEEVGLLDDDTFTFTVANQDGRPLSFIHPECEAIAALLVHMRANWEVQQQHHPVDSHLFLSEPHSRFRMRAKDVPGTLLNMALSHLSTPSLPMLRSAAYNLLCALSSAFNLGLEDELLWADGLSIPPSNCEDLPFVQRISSRLARAHPHLTLDFMEESVSRCTSSSHVKARLQYTIPWIDNLPRFIKNGGSSCNDTKRKRLVSIINKLLALSVQEGNLTATCWARIGQMNGDILDLTLDCFIESSLSVGLGSRHGEILLDTIVSLASLNGRAVSRKIIFRLFRILDATASNSTPSLAHHKSWTEITILTRYLLALSFDDLVDVSSHLPYLCYIVVMLAGIGCQSFRACLHGLTINVMHSLCTSSKVVLNEDSKKLLRLSLTELFTLTKFRSIFGVEDCKSIPLMAFTPIPFPCNYLKHTNDKGELPLLFVSPNDNRHETNTQQRDMYDNLFTSNDITPGPSLYYLEFLIDAFLEIIETCYKTIPDCDWLQIWTDLNKTFTFRSNPSLQPRAMIVYGCSNKSLNEQDIKHLLCILSKALESFDKNQILIESIILSLTRLEPIVPKNSLIHPSLFWVAIAVLQFEDIKFYECALALLEQVLHSLHGYGIFYENSLEHVMMSFRKPLDWHFKQIDHCVGLSFKHNFNFALVGHLIKGYRHPNTSVVSRTIRIFNHLLMITSLDNSNDQPKISLHNLPYITALLPVTEEIKLRYPIKKCKSPSHKSDSCACPISKKNIFNSQIEICALNHSSLLDDEKNRSDPFNHLSLTKTNRNSDPTISKKNVTFEDNLGIENQLTPRCFVNKDESMFFASKTRRSSSMPTPTCQSPDLQSDFSNLVLQSRFDNSLNSVSLGSLNTIHKVEPSTDDYSLLTSASSSPYLRETGLSFRDFFFSTVLTPKSHHTSLCSHENIFQLLRNNPDVQALLMVLLATLLRLDEYYNLPLASHNAVNGSSKKLVIYQYLAKASEIFPLVFPVVYNLIDGRQLMNSLLQVSNFNSSTLAHPLKSFETIINNSITFAHRSSLTTNALKFKGSNIYLPDITPVFPTPSPEVNDAVQEPPSLNAGPYEESHQHQVYQLSYLQTIGFGGFWTFAGSFNQNIVSSNNLELFISCLEAMMTCLPPSDDDSNFKCQASENDFENLPNAFQLKDGYFQAGRRVRSLTNPDSTSIDMCLSLQEGSLSELNLQNVNKISFELKLKENA
ncbi:neurofibromin-like [Gordionus sp. m RMFG-2023]|uniref:neurofibromin-like n=1 Tax=Gordionus sp. m RMFG-2023 TaxID=3053472 RepID=UPI0031FDE4C9